MDIKVLKQKYRYNNWLHKVNEMAQKDFTKQEAIDFEHKELDDWWWDGNYKDFSRYNSFHYLYAGLNCFNNYSKPCAFTAYEYLKDKNIQNIVDLGAGIGLSTMLLKDLFPDAGIYYNNLLDTIQYAFFLKHSDGKIDTVDDKAMAKYGPYDVLFASEYFEHFDWPINRLKFLRDEVGFKYLVVNNSFNVRAYGHFKEYFDEEENLIDPRAISRKWNKIIKNDYDQLKIKCWNGRPRIYMKR